MTASSAANDDLTSRRDNLPDEYIVLGVNIDDQPDLLKTLSITFDEDHIMMVNDIDSSLSLSNRKIYLILCDTWKTHIHKFVNNPQIIAIYIYSKDKDKHKLRRNNIENIRCTVLNIEQLPIQLHNDIKQLNGQWPFEEKSFRKALTLSSEWYHLFLLVISHHPKSIEKSYREMFDECRSYYSTNKCILEKIDQLAQTYTANNAIYEYTQPSFLYKITNHALRTQNMEIIRKFSPFITDLHDQLHECHRKYYDSDKQHIRTVYRAQNLTSDQLRYITSICKSRTPFIKLTAFTSGSLDPEVALAFIGSSSDLIPCLFEIIITDQYNLRHRHLHCFKQVFADISSLSSMADEQEVLFSLSTLFRVKYVGDPLVHPYRWWVPIVLELVTDEGRTNSTYYDIVECIQKEQNPQDYSDILNILEVNAADEQKFNKMNWQKCWNKFTNLWSTDIPREQPLLLTIYDCFTEDKTYLRKAIEMHKVIMNSKFYLRFNSSSFSSLVKEFKVMQINPTQGIALYEQYLKDLCTTNTKDAVDCLYLAGDMYQRVYGVMS